MIGNVKRSLLSTPRQPAAANERKGNLSFLKLELRLGLEQVITLLAMDFGVTRRFIEVRLKKYGLLPQELAVLYGDRPDRAHRHQAFRQSRV
jgi:hypothetical protein